MTDNIENTAGDGVENLTVADELHSEIELAAQEEPTQPPEEEQSADDGDNELRKVKNGYKNQKERADRWQSKAIGFQEQIKTLNKKLESVQQTKAAPTIDDYDSFMDFNEANTDYKLEQRQATLEKQSAETQRAQVLQQREEALLAQAKEHIERDPSATPIIQQYGNHYDYIMQSRPEIHELLFDSAISDPVSAWVEMGKNGEIESFINASPTMAAAILYNANRQAMKASNQSATTKQTTQPKPPISNAPPPPRNQTSGKANVAKSIDQMTPSELEAYFNKLG
jgi:archaellum component FlaC